MEDNKHCMPTSTTWGTSAPKLLTLVLSYLHIPSPKEEGFEEPSLSKFIAEYNDNVEEFMSASSTYIRDRLLEANVFPDNDVEVDVSLNHEAVSVNDKPFNIMITSSFGKMDLLVDGVIESGSDVLTVLEANYEGFK